MKRKSINPNELSALVASNLVMAYCIHLNQQPDKGEALAEVVNKYRLIASTISLFVPPSSDPKASSTSA
jgi:hypothetical protein